MGATDEDSLAVQKTPSEPITPPKASGSYVVNESIIAGRLSCCPQFPTQAHLTSISSIPSFRHDCRPRSQLWRISMEEEGKNLCLFADRRARELLPQGLPNHHSRTDSEANVSCSRW